MSYKVLYRKYRPNKFNEIVGQQQIVDNLQNCIKNNNFSHAYMFTGPRGTGKTSTAKVLAKAINCMNPKNGDACGECESCINIATTPDIIEIDAASNNGVDEIRELRNNITLAPASSKYKIYIIDEVHMLSPGAFNALLKTLEEPPAHAVFILATTEVYKVPITILSRCQRYDFKKIDHKIMVEYLKDVCNKEDIKYKDDAIEEIYSLSEGCLRDALSILDQTSKTSDELILENILKDYNIISNNTIKEILDCINNNDVQTIINKIDEFEDSGMNAQKLIKKIINYLEKIAVEIKLKNEKNYNFNMISNLIKELNDCYIDARINENTFTMIKICFLEQISTESAEITTKSNQKIEKKEENITQNTKEDEKVTIKSNENKPKSLTEIRVNNCFVEANKEALNNLLDTWVSLDDKISTLVVTDYKPVAASPNYAIFTADESSLADLFNIKRDDVEKKLKKQKITLKVVALTEEEWKKAKGLYVINLKKGIKYEYIDEPEPKDDGKKIREELGDLFTEKLVEIS